MAKPFLVQSKPQHEGAGTCDHRYAAIDIGSNGIRLLLSRVIQSGDYCVFTKESLVRMPIRLGEDVFSTGKVSDEKIHKLVKTMQAFKHLIDAYDPVASRSAATSAMREAENGGSIVDMVNAATGLELEIVDGSKEAEIILATHAEENLDDQAAYLYIDVGGGSTELSVYVAGEFTASRSFPLGTVRLLKQPNQEGTWSEMKSWIKDNASPHAPLSAIGSGGNINKIFRLAGRKADKPVSLKKLREIEELLNQYSVDERIRILHLRPDRADVIMPASKIFISAMSWAGIKHIHIPQFGLADGLVRQMHAETMSNEGATDPD